MGEAPLAPPRHSPIYIFFEIARNPGAPNGVQRRCSARIFLLAGKDELLVLLGDVFNLLGKFSLLAGADTV